MAGALRIEIFVADVAASAAFYERVLGFTREKDEAGYIAVRLGAAAIGICAAADLREGHDLRTRAAAGPPGGGIEIVIEVDDIDVANAVVIAAGYPLLSPLRTMPWGLRDFRLADPDGFYLRVTSR